MEPTDMTSVPQDLTRNIIYGLYCTCLNCRRTGKTCIRYVGQTTQPVVDRFRQHLWLRRTSKCKAVRGWVSKHGTENIHYVVLQFCLESSTLNDAEIRWIQQLDTYAPSSRRGGLNLSVGGDGTSDEARLARKSWWAERHHLYWKDVSCEVCEITFETRISRPKKTCGKTCAAKLSMRARSEDVLREKMEARCEVCSAPIPISTYPRSISNTPKTCSDICRASKTAKSLSERSLRFCAACGDRMPPKVYTKTCVKAECKAKFPPGRKRSS